MSKVQTADCVAAILAAGHKAAWKRSAKYRTEDPRELCPDWGRDCWLREFVNKTDNRIAFVWAFEDQILEVRVLTPAANARSAVTTKDGRKELVASPATVPMVKGGDGGWEEQDFENFEITFVEPGVVVVIHGGDWQEPMDVEYRMMSDGNLYYNPKTATV
jgi:hypothetical protein